MSASWFFGLCFVVLIVAVLRAKIRRDEEQNQTDQLQFWSTKYFVGSYAHWWSIHFPSMTLRTKNIDGSAHYHLRRTDGGRWERRLTEASYAREHERTRALDLFLDSAGYVAARDGNIWRSLDDPTVEVAFQRFIHAKGLRTVSFDELGWKDDGKIS